MKMAKASERDMNMAMKLCTALEWLERGDMPIDARAPDEADNEDFDSEDAEHCYRAMKEVLGIVRSGSIARVVWGMYVLLDPVNKIVDPDADTLEIHPDIRREQEDGARYQVLRAHRPGLLLDMLSDGAIPDEGLALQLDANLDARRRVGL